MMPPNPYYTIVIPRCPIVFSTQWHPGHREDDINPRTCGAFTSELLAIDWAKHHLNGTPYSVKLITE